MTICVKSTQIKSNQSNQIKSNIIVGPKVGQREDWIDVFSLAHARLLNRKAAALPFTRVYTLYLQYAITKYWQKAQYALPT